MLLLPTFDARSEEPLYRQLYDAMKRQIEDGQISVGTRLPATRELAGQLGWNRATVAAAYELLAADGLIDGQVGRGSFVAGRASSGIDWNRLLEENTSEPQAPTGSAISFASSRPPADLFPMEDFRASCRETIDSDGASQVLQLGSPYGYEPLREYLLDESLREGAARPSDEVLVTSGCQQALDLLQRALAPAGEAVAVEDPVYPGLKNLFGARGVRLLGLPVSGDGPDPDELERVLMRERPRLLVVTPTFHNPTGATQTLAMRLALLRAARAAGTIVVENDIYRELRYEGTSIPTLKQLDPAGDVVLLRSFSKVAFPGLRVGWVIGPRPLIARLADAKQWTDLHTDQLAQAVLLRFAESGRLAAHKRRILAAGAERLRAAIEGCERELPPGSRFTRPAGGMNLWVTLPEPLNAGELLEEARREGVAYLPGRYFAVSRRHASSLRISFAGLDPESIRRGMAILGGVFGREWKRRNSASRLEPMAALV